MVTCRTSDQSKSMETSRHKRQTYGYKGDLCKKCISLRHLPVAMSNPLAGPSALKDLIQPQFHQNNFSEELYIKNELGLKIDKGESNLLAMLLQCSRPRRRSDLPIVSKLDRMSIGTASLSASTYNPVFAQFPAAKAAPDAPTRS